MLHDSESDLCQTLLTRYDFPGTPLIGNISETMDARTLEKIFSRPTFKGQSIDILFNATFDF